MKRERDDFQEKESNNTRICIERRRLILVTLSAVLLLSYFSLGMNTQTQPITVDTDISPARLFSQAETHGPISIDGDVDFNDTAFVEGWTGNGSESNPFVIEDYEIDLDRAVGNCIEIVNTRVHFIIENCTLDGATTGRGVYLSNTTNGIIKEILSLENRYGIEVVWSEGIVITNNNCSYPMEFGYEGIRVAGNGSCVVANNTVVLHSPGIEIAGSSYTTVFNNSVTRAEETCISVIGGSAYTELLNNTCFNSETGIESRTHNVIIANNIMDDLNLRGVFIAGVHNNTIVDNMFTYCYMYGVTLVGDTFNATVERNIMENVNVGVEVREAWGSTPRNNTISWNSFKIPYTIEDAADNTTIDYNFYNLYHGQDMNQDGVGDTPYDATGWGDFIDYHPLILPLGSNPSWIHAPSNQVLMVTESFYQDVNATAYYPGVDSWWVNDTTFFSIDTFGKITNATFLPGGEYDIRVWVSDTYGKSIYADATITVNDYDAPVWIETPTDQISIGGSDVYYDLNATDISGIGAWSINDTINFQIDENGVITNSIIVPTGVYAILVQVFDVVGNELNATFTITVTDIDPPTWDEIPQYQFINPGLSFYYDLNASDYSGIHTWWLNDTLHFSIDSNGIITSNYILPEGFYGIQVWVNDTNGYATTTEFTLRIVRTVKVAILYGYYTYYPQYGPWDHLNTYWEDYGTVRLVIDYTTFSSNGFTLQDLEQSGADVLIMSDPWVIHTVEEMAALREFIEQGHGLYVSGRNPFIQDGLWKFLGLAEPVPSRSVQHVYHPYTIECPSHPIFNSMSDSFWFDYWFANYPTTDGWTRDVLDGAVILAQSPIRGVILSYRGMIYCSGEPEYMPSVLDYTAVQFIYNALAWTNYSIPQHQIGVSLDVPLTNQMGELAMINVTVHNRGLSDETGLVVELLLNGTLYDTVTIPWLGANSSTMVQFTWTPTSPCFYDWTAVVAPVSGEEMTCDNTYTEVVWAGDFVHVLWDMSHDNDESYDYSYEIIVNAMAARGFNTIEFWDSEINGSVLAHYNILVIVQPRLPYSPTEISAIQEFVMNGGGLIVIGDYDAAIMNSLTMFAGFNWSYSGSGGLGGPIDVAHPVTLGAVSCSFPSYGLRFNVTWPAIGLRESSNEYIFGASQIGLGKIVCVSDDEVFRNSPIEHDDNFILAMNSFIWTSTPAMPHDVMAHVYVDQYNVRYSPRALKISVLNLGTHVEQFLIVRLFINDIQVFADVVPFLNTSTLVELEYDWMPMESGFVNVTVTVDAVPGEYWLIDNQYSYLTEVVDWYIEIYSNDDFESQGWSGSGTEEDPYRIEDLYMIAIASFDTCIIIQDTTVYFVIRNCTFVGTDISEDRGINLVNITNGRILNNTFTGFLHGIWGMYVNSSVIANNTFDQNDKGFWVGDSLYNNITQNTFEYNLNAVMIQHTNFTTFENNTLRYNTNGLFIDNICNETLVRWNTFIDNDQNAIDDGEFNVFLENYWSNYTGIDANFDGFGDTPHPIPGLATSSDTHPLALPLHGDVIDWIIVPTDITVEYWQGVNVQLTATAIAGVDHYWLNDTTYLVVDGSGVITNSSILGFGIYTLEIRAYDPYGHFCSVVISITVQDGTPPEWVTAPTLQIVELGEVWTYHLDATDVSGLDTWDLNDTSRFSISGAGIISMNYLLPVGSYWLQVWVNDTAGNILVEVFEVQIQDTSSPVWVYEPADLLLSYGASLSYPVSAIDASTIDHYWVNDTANFAIDGNGLITSNHVLDCGIYNLEIRAYDIHGHYCEAVIEITIADVTMPSIDHPSDISYTEGETEHTISWHPLDDNPVSYEVWRDSTLIFSGSWNSSSESISINVDGLAAGAYVYVVIVTDYGEHETSDSVLVTVYPEGMVTTTTSTTTTVTSTTTTTSPPPDGNWPMTLMLGIGLGAGAVVIIVMAVLARKGRTGKPGS